MRLFGWMWVKMAPEGDAGTGGAGGSTVATTEPTMTATPPPAVVTAAAVQTPAPQPTQPTAPTAPSSALADENARLNAELKAALAAANSFTADELAKRRREIARAGMSVKMTDADLDKVLPNVDPRTPEGETALGRWRAERQDWYPAAVEAPRAKPDDMAARLPERLKTSSIFGPDALRHAHASMNAPRGGR